MQRRAMGLETEYGIQYTQNNLSPLAPDEVARYIFRPVVVWGNSSNVFLPNGARLYLDVGSHPEYATSETSSAAELVAADKSGDALFNKLIARASEAMAQDGFNGQIYLYRNNADSRGNSFGSHENYTITRNTRFRRLGDALIPFLVTRQLFCGGGTVVSAPEKLPDVENFPVPTQPHFAFSQRADYVQDGISSSSTRSRPIINTRDEPHADSSKFRRLHVIVGDSNMSETTMLARFATTDLLLQMIESGLPLPALELAHPVRAIRNVSHDMTGRATIDLRSGKTMTALEVQYEIFRLATDYVAQTDTGIPHLAEAMDIWQRALEAVETQNFSLIDTEVDWAIKHKFLTGYARRHDVDFDSPRLKQLDLSYHDINPDRGLFNLLEARGSARRVLTDDDVTDAMYHAPATTRAALREKFINTARAHHAEYSVDWSHVKLNSRPLQTIYLRDPLQTESDELDQLLSCLDSTDSVDSGATELGPDTW